MNLIKTKTIRNKILLVFSVTFLILLVALLLVNKIFLVDYYVQTNRNNMHEEVKRFLLLRNPENRETLADELIKNTGGRLYVFTENIQLIDKDDGQAEKLPFSTDKGKSIYDAAMASGEKGYFEVLGSGALEDQTLVYAVITNDGALLVVTKAMGLVAEASKMFFNFMMGTSVVIYLVGFMIIFFISGSLTRPISEMKRITRKMAKLEFDEKLEVNNSDEIGELMTSVNQMADELAGTIEALHSSNNQLERELSKERSLEKMRRRFVSDVSHELKNPISMILGYADGLVQNVPKTDADKREYYEIIVDEASRMNELVKNLLDLSSYESGTFTIEKEIFDLNELIGNAIERFGYIMDKKNVHIDYDAAAQFELMADRLRINQVIINLLGNAFKYVDDNGSIKIELEKTEERTKMTIANTGPLIPDKDLELIWNSFYQVDTDRNGNGLGLAIVKSIIDLHQGSCRAYTTDQYNCFEIIL